MKLSELDARFIGAGGEGVTDANGSAVPARRGIGLVFKCPCGKHDKYDLVFVGFRNLLDGGPPHETRCPLWDRTGDTIETLTLTPSILRTDPNGCAWHGYITNGETRDC